MFCLCNLSHTNKFQLQADLVGFMWQWPCNFWNTLGNSAVKNEFENNYQFNLFASFFIQIYQHCQRLSKSTLNATQIRKSICVLLKTFSWPLMIITISTHHSVSIPLSTEIDNDNVMNTVSHTKNCIYHSVGNKTKLHLNDYATHNPTLNT